APELVEAEYGHWIKNHLVEINRKLSDVKADQFEDQIGIAFFAMLMAELGETDLRDRLVRMAELRYRPRWEKDGSYHYPYFSEFVISAGPLSRFSAHGLTGKLLANALACPPDGMRKMHFEPFIGNDPSVPLVRGIDFPNIFLKRAAYDRKREALIVTLEDNPKRRKFLSAKTKFIIDRIDPGKHWILMVDGKKVQSCRGIKNISVEVPALGRHDIIFQGEIENPLKAQAVPQIRGTTTPTTF
ncbi:MAG: hypothetical protein HQK54_06865, partial [Oligoflexales bacterium]|nr:hypothetical protein [Oligoflexales bacterium]